MRILEGSVNNGAIVQHIGSSKNLILKTALIIKEFNFETALIKIKEFGT